MNRHHRRRSEKRRGHDTLQPSPTPVHSHAAAAFSTPTIPKWQGGFGEGREGDVTRGAEQNTSGHRTSLTSGVPLLRYEHSR